MDKENLQKILKMDDLELLRFLLVNPTAMFRAIVRYARELEMELEDIKRKIQ